MADSSGLCCWRHTPEPVEDCHRHQPGQDALDVIDDAFNSDKLIEFLAALIKDAGRKVFLILDNLRVHHSKPVKAWAEERKDKIDVVLPAQLKPGVES